MEYQSNYINLFFFFNDDSSDDNSSTLETLGIKYLHLLFSRIWNREFPISWDEASIISIPKKGDPTECDNYRSISLINNGIKLFNKNCYD